MAPACTYRNLIFQYEFHNWTYGSLRLRAEARKQSDPERSRARSRRRDRAGRPPGMRSRAIPSDPALRSTLLALATSTALASWLASCDRRADICHPRGHPARNYKQRNSAQSTKSVQRRRRKRGKISPPARALISTAPTGTKIILACHTGMQHTYPPTRRAWIQAGGP